MTQNNVVKIVDNNKKLTVVLTGNAAEPRNLKIDVGSLNYALNANAGILGVGTDRKSKYRMYLAAAKYSIQGGDVAGYVEISTDGDSTITGSGLSPITSGNVIIRVMNTGVQDFLSGVEPFTIPTCVVANTTGNIYLQTLGFQGNSSYWIALSFRKEPLDFDQGQGAAPGDFNLGPRSPMGSPSGNSKN